MSEAQRVTSEERTYLRDLSRRYLQYANLPVMAERAELWYAHNELKGPRPMIVFESGGALGEMMPKPKCTSPLAREIEWGLQVPITEYELLGDDKVISPEFRVGMQVHMREFDMDLTAHHAADAQGRTFGFAMDYPITDLAKDLPKLKKSTYHADRDATMAHKAAVEEVIGDLMPVVVTNWSLCWIGNPSYKVLRLMGMESMLMAMMDQPEGVKELYRFVTDDLKQYIRWHESEGLLTPNNGNHYAGAGSYGFSRELNPAADHVRLRDLWMNMNSQETVGISPEMFQEIVYPSYRDLAEMAGLVYFGCCEPVHSVWECCLSKLPNLRKVSVSPWCDEQKMGEWLRTAPVIYSRKPRPNYIGVGTYDDEAFAEHAAKTIRAARGGHLEFIFRDIYALDGDVSKPGKAVATCRRLIDKLW